MKVPFFDSELHDEATFYSKFIHDLLACKQEIIIESPFILFIFSLLIHNKLHVLYLFFLLALTLIIFESLMLW